MRSTLALVAASAALAYAAPQGITAEITPTGAAPAGCTGSFPAFAISVVNGSATAKAKRQEDSTLQIVLEDGVLTDSQGRTGYIAANYQFQFDAPVQTGAIYTAGFSVCENGTLALGDSAVFYQCLSGDFYNLYSENWAPQCEAIFLDALPVDAVASVSSASATGAATGAATGSATTAAAAATSSAVSSVSLTVSSAAVVSSIADGQIQGPTSAEAVTSSVVVVSAATTSAAVLTQITDGQVQAPTATSAVVTSALITSVAVVTQIGDGQIQAPTSTSTLATYTGAAALPTMAAQLMVAAAGLAAFAL